MSLQVSASVDSAFQFDDHDGTFAKPPPPARRTLGPTPSPPPARRSASPSATSPSRLHHVVSAFNAPPTTPTSSPAAESLSAKKTRRRRRRESDPDEFSEDDDIFELLRKYHHRRKQAPHLLPSSYTCSPRTLIRTEGVRASISAGSRPSSPERTDAPTPGRLHPRRGTWTHFFHSRQSSLSGTAVGSDTKSLTDLFGIIQDIQGMQYQDQRSPRRGTAHEVLRLRHDNDDKDDNDSTASEDEQARMDAMVQMLSTTPGVTSADRRDKHDADDSNDSAWNNVTAALDDEVRVVQPTRLFDNDDNDDTDDNDDNEHLAEATLGKASWVTSLVQGIVEQALLQAASEPTRHALNPFLLDDQWVGRAADLSARETGRETDRETKEVSSSPVATDADARLPSRPRQAYAGSPCQSPIKSLSAGPSPSPSQLVTRLGSNASSSAGSSPSHRSWRSLFRKREGSPAKLSAEKAISSADKATPNADKATPSNGPVLLGPDQSADADKSREDGDEIALPRDRILSTVSMLQAAPLVIVLEPDELETMV